MSNENLQELIYQGLTIRSLRYENRLMKNQIRILEMAINGVRSRNLYLCELNGELDKKLDGNAEVCADLIRELRGEG